MAITKPGDTQAFSYTGGVQTFIIPITGLYELAVNGASGPTEAMPSFNPSGSGSTEYAYGGKGGQCVGTVLLKKGSILYIVCGGRGIVRTWSNGSNSVPGGYNGGGSGTSAQLWDATFRSDRGSSGGGMTYISLGGTSRSQFLIVAGGGGGCACLDGGNSFSGGDGGYPNGGNEKGVYGGSKGGTQTAGGGGGNIISTVSAGSGSASHGGNGSAGGGGGWFGGGAGVKHYNGGGGGSGYFATSVQIVAYKNGIISGHGAAYIKLIEKIVPTMYIGSQQVDALMLGTTEISDMALGNIML